jgi:hypothetical protein
MPPANDLARRYADALAALRAVHAFDAWLGRHWHDHCPAPRDAPTSHTPLGTDGAITWHEGVETVTGYLPGDEGCFRIPRDEAMPDFPLVTRALPVSLGQDILISASMREADASADR